MTFLPRTSRSRSVWALASKNDLYELANIRLVIWALFKVMRKCNSAYESKFIKAQTNQKTESGYQ